MGKLIPRGGKVADQLTKEIKEKAKDKIYLDFIERFVLEKGIGNEGKRNKMTDIFFDAVRRNRKRELTEEEKKALVVNYRKVADEILETIGDSEAEIATFTFSRGGHNSSLEKEQQRNLREAAANVEYTTIMMNGVLVMEPIGQVDNATFIIDARNKTGEDSLRESLEAVKGISRDEAVKQGLMYRIIHRANKNEGYNFEAKHIAKVLELVKQDTDKFMQTVKANNGCGLIRVAKGMYSDTYTTIDKLVQDYALEKSETVNTEKKADIGVTPKDIQTENIAKKKEADGRGDE